MALDYRHIKKDPIIDLIRTEAQREGFLKGGTHRTISEDDNQKRSIKALSDDSGISSTTLYNWFKGKTKRPQSLSTRFVLEALGVRVQYVRANGNIIKAKGI
jgi:hypothetical protein